MTAALLVRAGQLPFGWDAVLHCFFVGFVFSMIFSHAPIILPAVLRAPVRLYRPHLYVPFVLLQVTLLLRVVADVWGSPFWRMIGGTGNAFSLLLFFALLVRILILEKKGKARR